MSGSIREYEERVKVAEEQVGYAENSVKRAGRFQQKQAKKLLEACTRRLLLAQDNLAAIKKIVGSEELQGQKGKHDASTLVEGTGETLAVGHQRTASHNAVKVEVGSVVILH